MLRNFIKMAIRNTWKNKAYAAINISGLSVGLASFIIILLYFNYELSFDKWHPGLKKIYKISMLNEGGFAGNNPPVPLAPLLKENDADIMAYTRIMFTDDYEALIGTGDKKIYQKGIAMVDSGFLDVFPYPLAQGNWRTALKQPGSALITEEISKKLFGNENPMGKTLSLYNAISCTVTGVIKPLSTPSHLNPQIVISDPSISQNNWWENYSYTAYVRTRTAMPTDKLEQKINAIYYNERIKKDTAAYASYLKTGHQLQLIVEAVPAIHNFPKYGETHFKTTVALLLLAVLLLLSGAINFSNLSLAQSFKKAKEVGIRKVLGSGRRQIALQFLVTVMLQYALSLLIAVVLVNFTLPLFNASFGLSLSFRQHSSVSLWLQLSAALVVLMLLSGLYPAIIQSRFKTVNVIKGYYSSGTKGRFFSNVLLVVQFVVSVFFIMSVLVIALQMQYLKNKDIGFNPAQVIRIEATQKTREDNFQQTRSRLLQISGIEYVSKSTAVPGSAKIDTSTRKFKYAGNEYPMTSVRISADYFKTLNIPVVKGRLFSDEYPQDNDNTAIINEAALQLLGTADPVGSLIRFPYCDSIPYQIVGVVKNFNVQSFETAVKPTVYSISNAHCGYQSGGALLVKVSTNHMQQTLHTITKAWKMVEPDFPIRYSFLDENFQHLLNNYERLQTLIFIFAVISILIATMGLLALTAYMAEKRTKEIGVRKVLGASVMDLNNLLAKDFIQMVVIAAVIALPLATVAMNQWLQNFAYRITISWWVFAVTVLIAVAVAWVTVSVQAIKAALANPVTSLRTE